ncbi:hypothetical protein BAE44_0018754 [Dichanthelium oligosanthes]|uniref:Pentatricopeptide repeat-containing protein n=1 Tax=Dichanthelium oligosanthes TaxID=888268 RepID=A0A1E5V550_9POAL|nr:hypothetical protein BAE44_0018754 [Dichanthelium oligosanthes]
MVYLHAVRSLSRQMKASGVVPDTFLLNLIIKAYARCVEVDSALKVFHEMPLYGCEPNEFTYAWLHCQGHVSEALDRQGDGVFCKDEGEGICAIRRRVHDRGVGIGIGMEFEESKRVRWLAAACIWAETRCQAFASNDTHIHAYVDFSKQCWLSF